MKLYKLYLIVNEWDSSKRVYSVLTINPYSIYVG
jgi:hypothetical protein